MLFKFVWNFSRIFCYFVIFSAFFIFVEGVVIQKGSRNIKFF